jgi:hypothetical protein
MDVLVFIEVRKLLVWRVRKWQAAAAAARVADVGTNLVALTTVTAAD